MITKQYSIMFSYSLSGFPYKQKRNPEFHFTLFILKSQMIWHVLTDIWLSVLYKLRIFLKKCHTCFNKYYKYRRIKIFYNTTLTKENGVHKFPKIKIDLQFAFKSDTIN